MKRLKDDENDDHDGAVEIDHEDSGVDKPPKIWEQNDRRLHYHQIRRGSNDNPNIRPSIVNNFQAATLRESFQRRLTTTTKITLNDDDDDEDGHDYHYNYDDVMEWPSPVSSLGSSFVGKHSSGGRDQNSLLTSRNAKQQQISKTVQHGTDSRDGNGRECTMVYMDKSPHPSYSMQRSQGKTQQLQQQPSHHQECQHLNARTEHYSSVLSPQSSSREEREDRGRLSSQLGDNENVDGGSMVSSLDSLASPVFPNLGKSSLLKKELPSFSETKTAAAAASTATTTSASLNAQASMKFDQYDFNDPSHRRPRSSFSKHKQPSTDKSDDKSIRIDGNGGGGNNYGDNINRASFRSSGLGDDIALQLEYSTKSMNTLHSSDGIDNCLHPRNATDKGRDDFDFAWKAFVDAFQFGHFEFGDCRDGGNNVVSIECDDDQVLAAKAYMGLGFVRQCKGELKSSLDAYQTALSLWEEMMGESVVAERLVPAILYTIATILVEMQRLLEASEYFTRALHLFKHGRNDSGRADILSTEGMLFSMLGEAKRALDCFQKVALGFQSAGSQPMSLKLATVMFEMGSLHSILEMYDKSAKCFNLALGIRKTLLGDSFLVARTHYSLGVTLASREIKTNSSAASEHLKEALRICKKVFDSEHIQSAIIVRALGVLDESTGDSLAASVWFAKELALRKMLLGEGTKQLWHFSIPVALDSRPSVSAFMLLTTFASRS